MTDDEAAVVLERDLVWLRDVTAYLRTKSPTVDRLLHIDHNDERIAAHERAIELLRVHEGASR